MSQIPLTLQVWHSIRDGHNTIAKLRDRFPMLYEDQVRHAVEKLRGKGNIETVVKASKLTPARYRVLEMPQPAKRRGYAERSQRSNRATPPRYMNIYAERPDAATHRLMVSLGMR